MPSIWIVRYVNTHMIIGVFSSETDARHEIAIEAKRGRTAYATRLFVL